MGKLLKEVKYMTAKISINTYKMSPDQNQDLVDSGLKMWFLVLGHRRMNAVTL